MRKEKIMIEIKNVSKTYNGEKKALKNVSFSVNDGEIFAFIGHNGAGKTTMIKSIVGILDFEEGDILINNISIKDSPVLCKKEMAYVPDNPDLYENMKAIDFINFVCESDAAVIPARHSANDPRRRIFLPKALTFPRCCAMPAKTTPDRRASP